MRPRRLAAPGLALALALGCASTGQRLVQPQVRERIMVFLPPWSEPALRPLIAELAADFALQPAAIWRIESLDEQCVVFELIDRDQSADSLASRIALDPRVRSASAVQTLHTLGDPYSHLQHGHQELRIADAHRVATGRGVRVAVVDSGVDFDHPDLQGRVVEARSFVLEGEGGGGFTGDPHGTAVAGVIAAGSNGVGVVGVAPAAELLALKACSHDEGPAAPAVCRSDSLALAIDFAIGARAEVVNLSLGGPRDGALERILTAALARGVVVVAAHDPTADGGSFPASHPGVLGVAVPGSLGAVLVAPADEVLTTVPGGRYDFMGGSSLAAAAASGVVALVRELRPGMPPAAIAELLTSTARPCEEGGGMVDAAAAVAMAAAGAVDGER